MRASGAAWTRLADHPTTIRNELSDLGWVRQRAAENVYPRTTELQLGLVAIIDRPEGSGAGFRLLAPSATDPVLARRDRTQGDQAVRHG